MSQVWKKSDFFLSSLEMDASSPQKTGFEKSKMATDYQDILTNINQYNGIGFTLLLAKEVGILETLLKAEKPMTSQEIANKNKLKERYTREVLACLVCVELLKASVVGDGVYIYHFEESAKRVFNNGINGPDILSPLTFMARYKDIKSIIRLDGPPGIGYCQEFSDHINALGEHNEDKIIDFLLDKVPQVKKGLEKGMRVLEFGSGYGLLIGKLAKKYPKSTFTATEPDVQLIDCMRKAIGHLPNVEFEFMDLCKLPEKSEKKYDWMFMKNCTHVIPHPGQTMKDTRALVSEPNGLFTYIDLVGKGDPLKALGDTWEALQYGRSIFCCLPMSYQEEDSEAYGCCWTKEKGIQITEEAGYEVETYAYSKCQVVFVCKPI